MSLHSISDKSVINSIRSAEYLSSRGKIQKRIRFWLSRWNFTLISKTTLGSISSLFADKHISVGIESKVSDSAYEKLGEHIFELSALLASNQKDRLSVGKKDFFLHNDEGRIWCKIMRFRYRSENLSCGFRVRWPIQNCHCMTAVPFFALVSSLFPKSISNTWKTNAASNSLKNTGSYTNRGFESIYWGKHFYVYSTTRSKDGNYQLYILKTPVAVCTKVPV